MSSVLGHCLVRDGLLPDETVRAALGRQIVYGGTLDTVLLEMGVIDEPTLWGALAAATGLPVPDRALLENVDSGLAALLDPTGTLPGLAVPLQRHGNRVQVMCAEPVNQAALHEAARALGLAVDLFVAPEVRVRAAAQTVLGAPVPARFLRLLARLVGSQPVRRWVSAHAAAPPPLPRAPINVVATVTPPPVPAPRAVAAPRAATRAPSSRSSNAGPRPTRARRQASPPPSEAPAPSLSGDPGDTMEGMAPLQQVMELSPAFAGPEEASSDPAFGDVGDAPAHAPEPAAAPASGDVPPPSGPGGGPPDERLLRTAEDPAAADRMPALWALRVHLRHPRVRALADGLRDDVTHSPGERAVTAAAALGELRDPLSVPALIGRLGDKDGALTRAAHQALVAITRQDLGHGARRWRTWWDKHQDEERMDWLFAGLSHKSPEVRATSSEELRVLTGQYFGYHHDLPRREREDARARWESWWLSNRGGARS